jgi:hypothetical protein
MHRIISARWFLVSGYFHLITRSVNQAKKETERPTLEKLERGALANSKPLKPLRTRLAKRFLKVARQKRMDHRTF